MARPKGSKNKLKGKQVEVKAKAKAKPPQKAEPPDWLRKAMAPTKTQQKRGPRPTAVKEKAQTLAKAKRGRKPMATNKPLYDPMDDPDLRAPDPKDVQLDKSLPPKQPPPKQHKPTPLVAEVEPEPAPLFDEVAAGEAVPYDNIEMLIAGTLGGSGDNHASAKHILGRFAEANWLITKGDEGTPAGKAMKARKDADAKAKKETKDDDRKEFRGKATKEGDDATF